MGGVARSVKAWVTGYNKRWVWLRIPYKESFAGLTLPRKWLTRGYAMHTALEVVVDYSTLHHDGHGWKADVKIVRGIA